MQARLGRIVAAAALVGTLAVPVVGSPVSAVVVPSDPVINEVGYSDGSTDQEFVEVYGGPSTDYSAYTILQIDSDAGDAGEIDHVVAVGTTDANGIWSTTVPSNSFENGDTTFLLVETFTGADNDDLDTVGGAGDAGDGTFDTTPWTRIVDSVSIDDAGGVFYGTPVLDESFDDARLPTNTFSPGGISRIPDGTDTDTAADWYRNDYDWDGTTNGSPEIGEALNTPGAPNQIVVPADPVINEIGASDASTDNEFAEIFGDPDTDYSAYTLLGIEGDGTSNEGTVDNAVPIGSTDAGGLWLIDPAPSFENGSITFLLVEGFTGTPGDDLDTDDDGTFDTTPWSRIVDSVAIDDGGATDQHYGTPVLDESFDDARLPTNTFSPGGISRIPDGTDTDTAADWYRNDYDWDGTNNGSPEAGEALNTPGAPNQIVPPPPPAVYINEIDADTAGTDDAEFIELTDGGTGNTALDGLVIVAVNGSGEVSYRAFDLDGQSTDANGYFVLCGDAANVTNCDLDVTPDTNLFQNGPDAVALYAADDTDFPNGTAATTTDLVDVVVYDTNDADDAGLISLLLIGGQVNEDDNGDKDNHSNSRCPDGSGTGRDTSSYSAVPPTPGVSNVCALPAATISEIQGDGPAVAITTAVSVQAIVTSLFEDDDVVEGFFVQEEDTDNDANADTSEGIFVYCDTNCPGALAIGDLVTVEGTPTDFIGMSQIVATAAGSVVIDSSGNTLPTPATVNLPASASTDAEATFESVEGMLVTFPATLAVSEYFEFARFGHIVLTETSRATQFTQANAPDTTGYSAFLDTLDTRQIFLDDDNNDQNDAIFGPDADEVYPYGTGLSTTNRFRGGDTITNLTGVMHWSWAGSGSNAWRIRPSDFDYSFTSANPAPATPPAVGGDVTVATMNVLNYFTTLDEGANTCGPNSDDCRGANSAAELARQKAKIVKALDDLDADVIGLLEIENDVDDSSVADLVAGLNALAGAGTYDYIATGYVGPDAIKVALIYQPAVVDPVGVTVEFDAPAFLDPNNLGDDKNRAALIQTFEDGNGERFTVAVNHLKSKGSPCGAPDDATDGSGNCNDTRAKAATALANYLGTDPTGSGDTDFLIIGDLNAYAMEQPIQNLAGAGYTDLVASLAPGSYSYLFDGQLGTLDYIMSSGTLTGQVTGAGIWNINADEVPIFDYNDNVQDSNEASFQRESEVLATHADDELRSSDHDPVIIGLSLTSPPEATAAAAVGQDDPTNSSPITFRVTFDQDVTGFDASDVAVGGTAGATSAVVTQVDPAAYDIDLSGMTQSGTVEISVAADSATNVSGQGNTASGVASVDYDATAPVVTVPGKITVDNDPGEAGAIVNFVASAVDDSDPGVPDVLTEADYSLTVTCTPVSGSFFTLGETTVTCTATDAAGNEGSAQFVVEVVDVEDPVVDDPADVNATAAGSDGAVVTYSLPPADDNAPGTTVECDPASGSTFPIGTTTVTCTATDGAGNTSTSSFAVTVSAPAELPPTGGDPDVTLRLAALIALAGLGLVATTRRRRHA